MKTLNLKKKRMKEEDSGIGRRFRYWLLVECAKKKKKFELFLTDVAPCAEFAMCKNALTKVTANGIRGTTFNAICV